MLKKLDAVYEKGYLKPLIPLNLQENETVHIVILPGNLTDEKDEIIQFMIKADLLNPSKLMKFSYTPDPVSEEERNDLAAKLGKAAEKPISEIIIEEKIL
jgi:predicted DNA-binding antitoxin AbrB/MazE fold protein